MGLTNIINKWSVSRKLTTLVAVCAVTTGLIAGSGTAYIGGQSLEEVHAQSLAKFAHDKKIQVENYLKNIRADLLANADSSETVKILNEFNDGWNNLKTPKAYLQQVFIHDNPNEAGQKDKLIDSGDGTYYGDVHKAYHPHFLSIKDQKGYYDVFLINENGDIVYTVYKELDYATNLENGQWANSDLGNVFKKAKEAGKKDVIAFSDFAPYAPSNNVPASFIAAPIYDGDTFKGVIAYQMPIDRFNSVFHDDEKTVDSYAVGMDGILRSNTPYTEQDDILVTKAKLTNFKDFIGKSLDDQAGLSYPNSLYSADLIDFEGVKWYSVTEKNVSVIYDSKTHMQLFGFILSVLASATTAIGGYLLAKRLSTPIGLLSETVDKLAQGYIVDIPCQNYGDEIGNLARSMGAIHKKAIDSARIETAVEGSRACLMISDVTGNVIYANKSIRESLSDSRKYLNIHMPKVSVDELTKNHIADFFAGRGDEMNGLLKGLKQAYTTEASFDDRYFDVTISPVHDKSGTHVGYVTEWSEKTEQVKAAQEADRVRANEEMVEAEIAEVIQSAACGNFQVKLNTNHDRAFIKSVAGGINQICSAVDEFFDELNAVVTSFAQGDLTRTLKGNYSGQFEDVKSSLNGSFQTLKETIKQITTVGNGIRSASSDITQGADDLSGRTEAQAASIEETVATMEEISASVRNNANSAVQAANLASDALVQAEEGSRVVAQAVTAMQSLENSSHRIAEIVSVIDSIASQTNLLALNAAVEAARAGEAGKGFAVVASEVRTLASRCSEAARDIRGLISGSNAQVVDGVKLVSATGSALRQIVESVNEVSQTIASISLASREQATGVEEISGAISQMDEMTQQNAALSDESAAAARSLAKEAEHLAGLVRHFKTEDIANMLNNVSKDLSSVKKDLPKFSAKSSSVKDSFDDFGGSEFGMASGDDWSDL